MWNKKISIIMLFLGLTSQLNAINNAITLPSQLSLSTTATWKDFTLSPTHNQFRSKRLVWTGMITLKSTQPINLQELHLQWRGEKIARLQASLYQKKETDNLLIPIQENLVCDGLWNARKQMLTFHLDKKIVAVNKYYLFLNFAENDAYKVKHGAFIIPEKKSLKLSFLQ